MWNLVSHAGWLMGVMDVMVGGEPVVFGNLQAFRAWVDAQFDAAVSWRDLEWFRGLWDGPLVVKGILDPDDARMAADAAPCVTIVVASIEPRTGGDDERGKWRDTDKHLRTVPAPDMLQTLGTALRNAGLVGMGHAILFGSPGEAAE